MSILCYQDLLDHVLSYGGDDATQAGTTKHRRAVQQAYSFVATRHPWVYLWTLGRVVTSQPYATGTVAYTAASNALTLTGGTWPDWAGDGYVLIGDTPYSVALRVSDTVLALAANDKPAADVAGGTPFQLLRDSYPLPADFVAGDEQVMGQNGVALEWVHPREWMNERRRGVGPGQPWRFSYVGDPARRQSLKMVLSPVPDTVYVIDFLYRRRPRELFYDFHSTGLVSVAQDGVTVTGTGTAFKGRMVGSVIRFGEDNQTAPTGPAGGVPCLYERTITAVASATSLTVGEPVPEALDQVKFVVTDPADVETDMAEYLLRECEKQWRIVARSVVEGLRETPEYQLAFTRALEADNKTTSRAASLRRQQRRSGLLQYPLTLGIV